VVPGKGEVTYVLRAAIAQAASESLSRRVIGVLFDATDQARAEDRMRTINTELGHRLKNIANLAGIFARQTWPDDEQLEVYLGRLRALALSADLMFGKAKQNLTLQAVVEQSLVPFRRKEHNPFHLYGGDMALDEAIFTGVALLLHELATNAVKHGALSSPQGKVILNWRTKGDTLHFEWRERGGPPVRKPDSHGFGLGLLFRGALPPPHAVNLDFRPEGLVATISAVMKS
jgi:two-component sensor histidine kinase